MSEAQRYWAYNRDLGETPEPGQIIVVTLEAHHAVVKALRDERDRLQLHIKSLGGRFKRLDAFLANWRTVEAHQLVKNTIEALEKIEAALTPAGGGQE